MRMVLLRIAPEAEMSVKSSTVPLVATSSTRRASADGISIDRNAGRKRGVRFGGGVLRVCTTIFTVSTRASRVCRLCHSSGSISMRPSTPSMLSETSSCSSSKWRSLRPPAIVPDAPSAFMVTLPMRSGSRVTMNCSPPSV